ncbi:10784_t:CDS:1, partial [Racocetra persica]
MAFEENSGPAEPCLFNEESHHFDNEPTHSDDSDYENLDNNAWFPTEEI